MPAYLMETHDADELVAEDPFGGVGVFLPAALPDGSEILDAVAEVFGAIPAAAFPLRGAWIDASGLGPRSGEALSRWEER